MILAELVVYLAVSMVLMSFIEYMAHRWPMHNKAFVNRFRFFRGTLETHAALHHGRYYKDFNHDDDPAAKHISMTMSAFEHVAGLCPIWLLFWWLVGWPLALIFASTVAFHAIFWTLIHREMHGVTTGWVSGLWPYRYLRAYHQAHHDHPNKNFNVVFLGMDHLFGTHIEPNYE